MYEHFSLPLLVLDHSHVALPHFPIIHLFHRSFSLPFSAGNRTTGDPRVFGPYTWRTVHRFAQFYPIDPTTEVQEACVNFINALPFLLPCPHCGHDFVDVRLETRMSEEEG